AVARFSRSLAGGRRTAAGRRVRRARAAVRIPARRRRLRRAHVAPLPVHPLRLPVAARDRGAAAARRRAGRLPAPAVLARLLPPRPAALPAQRALGVPGALPWLLVEPRRDAVRGVVLRPDRLSLRGCR